SRTRAGRSDAPATRRYPYPCFHSAYAHGMPPVSTRGIAWNVLLRRRLGRVHAQTTTGQYHVSGDQKQRRRVQERNRDLGNRQWIPLYRTLLDHFAKFARGNGGRVWTRRGNVSFRDRHAVDQHGYRSWVQKSFERLT